MTWVGWILAVGGAVPFILDWMGMLDTFIPPLAKMNIPPAAFAGIGVVGVVIAMMFRRPRD
jgi:hypothetical protein